MDEKVTAWPAVSQAIGPAVAPPVETMAPADVRVANLTRILAELRAHGSLSRSDLARRTGLAVPTVHRLISELSATRLVIEHAPAADESRLGRPPVVYRFRGEAGFIAGLDVGNQTTRAALVSLAGEAKASCSVSTADIADALADNISDLILRLLDEIDVSRDRLAGIGVGVAAAVRPTTGVLSDPPRYRQWHGLPLADQLRARFDVEASVHQDDHLAAQAECSSVGTVPGARSIVVLAIGAGIGTGVALDSVPISGQDGRFGRIAAWPVTAPRGVRLPGATLGECLTTGGLVTQYRDRGGQGAVEDGESLSRLAREGDSVARTVLAWAAREIAGVVQRLRTLFDPEALVLGGGLAGAFDLLEREMARHTGAPGSGLRRSVLGEYAVLTGALLAGQGCVEPWLHTQLARL